ncbi:MAG: hypothetical protein JWM72_4043, partial [Actinomycetia bacterium]|nr:hypothetical protein [Actinomycetes bacterium]
MTARTRASVGRSLRENQRWTRACRVIVSILGIAVGGVVIPCDARAQEELPMATALDVVRAAF